MEEQVNGQSHLDEVIGQDDLTAMFQNETERSVAAKVLVPLASRIRAISEARSAKKLEAQVTQLIADNKNIIEKELEKLRKANAPITNEEMQRLLTQEYLEFQVQLRDKKGTRDFILRELPMDVEAKLLRAVSKTLAQRLQEVGGIEWDQGSNMVERIQKIVSVVPGAMETLAECVAVCLNPYGDEEGVDVAWVMRNVGMTRIVAIIQAQFKVGRYRDFAASISQLTPSMIQ